MPTNLDFSFLTNSETHSRSRSHTALRVSLRLDFFSRSDWRVGEEKGARSERAKRGRRARAASEGGNDSTRSGISGEGEGSAQEALMHSQYESAVFRAQRRRIFDNYFAEPKGQLKGRESQADRAAW
eukprot:1691729-Pleurochrysis_carterae.AAC.1